MAVDEVGGDAVVGDACVGAVGVGVSDGRDRSALTFEIARLSRSSAIGVVRHMMAVGRARMSEPLPWECFSVLPEVVGSPVRARVVSAVRVVPPMSGGLVLNHAR